MSHMIFFSEAAWKVGNWDSTSSGTVTTTFWQIPAAEGKVLAKDTTPVGLKCKHLPYRLHSEEKAEESSPQEHNSLSCTWKHIDKEAPQAPRLSLCCTGYSNGL